jgi:RNA-binding protein involved in rRNA processing
MDFLGIVSEITSEKQAVVIGSKVPDTGNSVFDSKKNKIGTVKRIFGPVDEPYISITLDKGVSFEGLKGKEVYISGSAQNGKDKRRNRRN